MNNILVIDDSENMRQLIAHTLHKIPDINVIEAEDGLDALKKLTSGTFDLIITDIHMPAMDGIKVIEHIRLNPVNKDLPIIITTTDDEKSDTKRALSLGATDYITKPINSHKLLELVKQFLPL